MKYQSTIKSWLGFLLIFLAALLYLSPILMMLAGSLKPDDRVLPEAGSWRALLPAWHFQNYADVFRRTPFLRYLINSLFITGSIVVLGLWINSMAAYSLARLQWKGRDLSLGVILALMILPFEAIAVPLFYLVMLLGWRDTYTAQILPFIANPFSIFLFYSFMIGLPRETEEAAQLDGAGPFRIYWSMILPNSKPVLVSVTIITFLMYWGSFLWPVMITSGERVRPLPVAIASFYTLPPLEWGDILAFGVLMALPVLVVFLVFQRGFVQGIAGSGGK